MVKGFRDTVVFDPNICRRSLAASEIWGSSGPVHPREEAYVVPVVVCVGLAVVPVEKLAGYFLTIIGKATALRGSRPRTKTIRRQVPWGVSANSSED